MSYHVSTSVFEGPLDLLLQLITRHQVDVTAVKLTDLVTEYVAHLEEMRRLDLDVTSEFLLIAATLVQLKAHALLPADAEIDLDEELALMEERDRLLARLLTCVTFKDVAVVLRHRLQETNRLVPRVSGLDQEIRVSPPDVLIPVDPIGLARIAANAIATSNREPDLDHLDLDLPSVQAAIDELRVRIAEEIETGFDDLVSHCRRPVEVAAYFLALLELARWGMVAISQDDWLSEIKVSHRADGSGEFVSEWSV
ncbi:MAG TPA: ScpA family protein [Acidimicrobiia bacterium]|jgi:segregation and condensation protein A|nr:ScpA family protein [Acidimicrobiia bacterium]